VSVDVATFQTSAANVPKVVKERVGDAQTSAAVMLLSPATRFDVFVTKAPIDDEAASIAESVCELTADVIPAVALLVFAFTLEAIPLMPEPSEDEAAATAAFVLAVPAVITEARELEAMSVCAFTDDVIPEVCELVFELMLDANEVEAAKTAVSVCELTAEVMPAVCVFVFEFTLAVPAEIAEASDEDAVVTSD
jgi:hypothetical protein